MYDDYDEHEHHGSHNISHDLIAGGAAFEAMKMFENHQRREGKTVKHGLAKDLLAGIVGAEVDKLFRRKGLENEYDHDRARRDARRQAEYLYDAQYSQYDQYDP